jgi:hypothetical protein
MARSGSCAVSALLASLLGGFGVPAAAADGAWLESGDPLLRTDLQLLNDAQIIRYPLNQWPIPRAGLRYALANAKDHFATNAAVQAALERVRARVTARDESSISLNTVARAGDAGLLRDFDTMARENAELGGGLDFESGRFSVGIDLVGVANPDDDQQVRADGSHLTVQLGNWLVSANALERWWGPAHESSLILSNNARPMPTLTLERAEARPFESAWLSWLGPWRFNFAISQMEGDREDIDLPLFMAWRVVIMPFKDVEIGFSRTAQFCGEQLECSWSVFGNLLAGNDNVGIDSTPDSEPGNQMAGFDLRWGSPIGNWPYAVYAQYIGEDESSYVPAKYLGQMGIEAWKPFASGAILQVYSEYANTTASGLSARGPYYNTAYTQGRFNIEGYRYRGRVIGHTVDADSETYAIGATYTEARGTTWSLTARAARINFDGFDARHSVSPEPADYVALELGWRGRIFGERVSVEIGAESLSPEGGDRDFGPVGFVGWRHDFEP